MKALRPPLPAGSRLYAEAAYTDYEWEEAWRPVEHVDRRATRRAHSPRAHEPWQALLIQSFRQGIETTISQSTERFLKALHAVTAQGVALKRLLFVFTHTLAQLGAESATWVSYSLLT